MNQAVINDPLSTGIPDEAEQKNAADNSVTLAIKGMTCAGCASRLEKSISKIAGVEKATVNLPLEQASVTVDEKQFKLDQLIKQVRDTGFDVQSETIDLNIEGMTCANCTARVTKALAEVPGVLNSNVNAATDRATIEWTGGDTAQLIDAIRKAGYQASPALGSGDLRRKQHEENTLRIRKQVRSELILFAISAMLTLPLVMQMVVSMAGFHFKMPGWAELVLATPVQFWIGLRFYKGAWNAVKGGTGNMDTLVVLGTSAAYFYSIYLLVSPPANFGGHYYFEASAVIITLILLGKILESRAKRSTATAIFELMALRPDTANIIRHGEEIAIPLEQVRPGDIAIVRPGERIPVDGIIVEGQSQADESLITGESLPVNKSPDDLTTGGSINGTGRLIIRATKVGEDTTLNKIIRMVEKAQSGKAPIQRLVDKVSSIFVPAIIVISLLTLAGWILFGGTFEQALVASVSVLVIACPCALGLATPTAIVAGTGAAARAGILFKDVEALEQAHRVNTIIFDKTGTLTLGKPSVVDIHAIGLEPEQLISAAASLQHSSEHPLALAISNYALEHQAIIHKADNFQSHTGMGVSGTVEEQSVLIGNIRLMQQSGITLDDGLLELKKEWEAQGRTAILIAIDQVLRGMVAIADPIREQTPAAMKSLQRENIATYMLTGDATATAATIAQKAGITEFKAEVMPDDKAEFIAKLQEKGKRIAMVGDGVNDAPALALADIGMAMGSGSDIALETAGVTLMRPDPSLVLEAINVSKATWRKLWQNLFWAFIYNIIGIPLAIMGLLNPAIAGAAMALSSVSVVTSSLMLRFWKPGSQTANKT